MRRSSAMSSRPSRVHHYYSRISTRPFGRAGITERSSNFEKLSSSSYARLYPLLLFHHLPSPPTRLSAPRFFSLSP